MEFIECVIAVVTVIADMCAGTMPGPFNMVIILFKTLYLLIEKEHINTNRLSLNA